MSYLKLVNEFNKSEFKSNKVEVTNVEYKIIKTGELPKNLKGRLTFWYGEAPIRSWVILYRYIEQDDYAIAAKFVKTRKKALSIVKQFKAEDIHRYINERRASMYCIYSAPIDGVERLKRNINKWRKIEKRLQAERKQLINNTK